MDDEDPALVCDGVLTTDELRGDMGGGELIVEGVEGVECRREKLANVSEDTIGGFSY